MKNTKKMTTSQKAAELVQDLGLNHAIYVTEEVIEILKDWEGTELAQNDWVEIEEIIRNMKKLTFKPYKEQILVQSSIEGEVIWEDKEILKKDELLSNLILKSVKLSETDSYNRKIVRLDKLQEILTNEILK